MKNWHVLTMDNRGEAYMIIVKPEQNIPRTLSWIVPWRAKRVTEMTVPRKPTSKIATQSAVLTYINVHTQGHQTGTN